MTKLLVEEMHCERCVSRIHTALENAQIKHEVDLATKIVTIDGCEHCVKTAISELDDLGFSAVVQ